MRLLLEFLAKIRFISVFLRLFKKKEMEVQFSRDEQEAVAHVLFNLVKADFLSHNDENECLKQCLAELDFDDNDFIPIPQNELQKKVYDTLKNMTKEKKIVFSRMMTQVSRSDGNFGVHERALVIEILEMCDVPFVHR